MSVDNLSDDLSEDAPEPVQAEGTYPLTPRMIAIAKGEDPDAITSEADDAPADEPEVDPADDAGEVAEQPADDTPEPTSWVTEGDKQRARAYGLDPEDLAAYSSREEFGRITRAIDKAASRREPTAPKAVETPAPKVDEVVDDTKPRDANGKLNLAYYEKNFDEATVELVREQIAKDDLIAKQNQAIESFRQEQEEAAWIRHTNEFHRAAEEIRPEFFGRTTDKSGLPVDLSPAELDRRQKLWNAANIISDHMLREQERSGLQPSLPPWANILKQAEVLAFGEELAKFEQAAQKASKQATRTEQLQRVAAQSQRRRPVAQTAGTHAAYRGAPPSDPHSTEAILQHPTMEAVLRRINDKSR